MIRLRDPHRWKSALSSFTPSFGLILQLCALRARRATNGRYRGTPVGTKGAYRPVPTLVHFGGAPLRPIKSVTRNPAERKTEMPSTACCIALLMVLSMICICGALLNLHDLRVRRFERSHAPERFSLTSCWVTWSRHVFSTAGPSAEKTLTRSRTPVMAVLNELPWFEEVFKTPEACACCASEGEERMYQAGLRCNQLQTAKRPQEAR